MDVQLPDPTPEAIGRRIRNLLAQLGQTGAWLAERAGVERSTVSRILNEERNPKPETLQEFAPVLGLTLEQLVFGTNAAERVAEAQNLVSRAHYERAVTELLAYEQKANALASRVRELEGALKGTEDRCRNAERRADTAERERDEARRAAAHHELNAEKYLEALHDAVTDLARLQTQVQELSKTADDGRRSASIGAALAGIAAVASMATAAAYVAKARASNGPRHETKTKVSTETAAGTKRARKGREE